MSDKIKMTIAKIKPIRMWIDGKCFNLKRYKGYAKKFNSGAEKDKADENEEKEIEFQLENLEFEKDESGNLSTKFELPTCYYKRLRQNEFLDLSSLKNKTSTNIIIPDNGKLVVSGDNEDNIKEALYELHTAIGQIRHVSMPLQFIAIPLLNEDIKKNFLQFKTDILKDVNSIRGMDETIFMSALKLHLTIDVFVLLNEGEKKEAIQVLNDYCENILKPIIEKAGPLKIHVAGIDCMNNNYHNVDVLYAKAKLVNETEEVNLQNIVNGVAQYFYERGLAKKHQEQIKLHMTLINTKYRKELNGSRRKFRKRISFDATKIMEKYKDFEFGECDFNAIHLSNITTVGKDGFYEPLTIINL